MSTSGSQPLVADLADLKSCCATFYASDWARLLLGESLHPGGLVLTGRLGALLGLERNARVLDVASGSGRSAVSLAERFGWSVTALDLTDDHSAAVAAAAARAGVSDRVTFVRGDAEALPFADEAFDAVICECALCTFPTKEDACAEFYRVLRPGGRIGVSDVTRNGSLPDDLASMLAWVACIADAQPIAGYRSLLTAAGFAVDHEERHDSALQQMVEDIRRRLLGVELVAKLQELDLSGVDIAQAKSLARSAEHAVRSGVLGYGLLVGTKPQSASGSCVPSEPESRADAQPARGRPTTSRPGSPISRRTSTTRTRPTSSGALTATVTPEDSPAFWVFPGPHARPDRLRHPENPIGTEQPVLFLGVPTELRTVTPEGV